MDQWRAAGPALEAVRVEELACLTEERNAQIAASFSQCGRVPIRPTETSGLVMQQEIFRRALENESRP